MQRARAAPAVPHPDGDDGEPLPAPVAHLPRQYLLQHTELMVSEVAMRCGFEDSNYFSVVFNREVGMTPVQWRHRSRKAA